MASRKITDLSVYTTITANDLLVVVSIAGPTTYKMTLASLVNAIPSNANFLANVSVSGSLAANTITASGNVVFKTANYLVSNNFIVTKNNTPANSTSGVIAGEAGIIWSDGSYIYLQANSTSYKRVLASTF